jgi:hypothetical protein
LQEIFSENQNTETASETATVSTKPTTKSKV